MVRSVVLLTPFVRPRAEMWTFTMLLLLEGAPARYRYAESGLVRALPFKATIWTRGIWLGLALRAKSFKKTKCFPSAFKVRKITLGLQQQPGTPKFSLVTLGLVLWAALKTMPMPSSSFVIMTSLDLFTFR